MNTNLRKIKMLSLLIAATVIQAATHAAWADIPRTADGRPDLNGSYNVATLTPTQRPKLFGEKEYLTKEEAEKMAADEAALIADYRRTGRKLPRALRGASRDGAARADQPPTRSSTLEPDAPAGRTRQARHRKP